MRIEQPISFLNPSSLPVIASVGIHFCTLPIMKNVVYFRILKWMRSKKNINSDTRIPMLKDAPHCPNLQLRGFHFTLLITQNPVHSVVATVYCI